LISNKFLTKIIKKKQKNLASLIQQISPIFIRPHLIFQHLSPSYQLSPSYLPPFSQKHSHDPTPHRAYSSPKDRNAETSNFATSPTAF
jgi:hypothetical protein